ncbi:pyridoxamine 5'-phosphate oxidase [Acidipila sp. EB88]|uniref:pyridoxamine 5'-phosphate oxidase n=1 Tax=Acidipila sp. EB88 TaxID=2305226 RepID=UPI000F5DD4BF|nr:pyridoxamine 5'-phosphate oxidase [Acidipila sp. EB88]RRA48208.1 pyridoxamine 5'-phosphate oxidase [Acidipila sp. EB88]
MTDRPQPLTLPDNPIQAFDQWFAEAGTSEPNDPNAAALATATPSGAPSVRMVLVKQIDQRGFCFFTNAQSQKGTELAANPQAALCFHWKSLRRQVRVEGSVLDLPDAEVDTYFHSRGRRSQLGAAVSQQSRPLASREQLEQEVQQFTEAHPGEVPRPSYWRGYILVPAAIELWMDGTDRLHNRFRYTRDAQSPSGWTRIRLYP